VKPMPTDLPEFLRQLFWDVNFNALEWQTDRDLIVRRILQAGNWSAIRWLRSTWGDERLRDWLQVHAGGRLSPRQLRYWALVLDLPAQEVDRWIAQAKNNPWGRRSQT